jgi:ADP-Ribosyltransferase in polyvalent proteins
MNQLLADILTAQEAESQRRLTHSRPPPQSPLGFLDTMALSTAPIPVVGDILGLAADANRYLREPESRTPLNFGLSALGLLPFVPSVAGTLGKGGARLGETLDLAPEARMSRAKEQGYIGPLYHGTVHRPQMDTGYTGPGIEAFDPKSASTQTAWYGKGHYLTANPEMASEFAMGDPSLVTRGGTVYPLMARIKNPFVVNKGEGGDAALQKTLSSMKGWTQKERDLINSEPLNIERVVSDVGPERFTQVLKANGHDSTIVHRVDPSGQIHQSMDEVVAFDPNQIRSAHAQFDPNKQGSSDLLASLLLGGVGLPLMMQAAQNPEQD